MNPLRPLTRRQSQLETALLELVLAEGFAHLTLDDLAVRLGCSKRTLYALAPSKEQLVTRIVRLFFRTAAEQVEQTTRRTRSPARRLTRYLEEVATALSPASRRFLADVSAFTPAAEIYELNTQLATKRVRELVAEGIAAREFRDVHALFVAEVVAATMRRIGSGELQRATGLTDAEAYRHLADVAVAALRR
ncbi:TetR/AcrR family transcriptional regulator [Desertihabitans brevis]|uniref:TetR/AcrR family transcriptional regulator n=1 Tax=Desertihabitans brevis TaxID=2268447 RepID=A0A367Z0B8_9ACTN|nr:TetR/AcrR family transcriptional regulator [Desertihabitans brevis]RCK70651.1 TetR/AcrR family transcriptional regulator [Desertihabitans brevis]